MLIARLTMHACTHTVSSQRGLSSMHCSVHAPDEWFERFIGRLVGFMRNRSAEFVQTGVTEHAGDL